VTDTWYEKVRAKIYGEKIEQKDNIFSSMIEYFITSSDKNDINYTGIKNNSSNNNNSNNNSNSSSNNNSNSSSNNNENTVRSSDKVTRISGDDSKKGCTVS
jgi:hypothetical protein